jgi:hypothetical protein
MSSEEIIARKIETPDDLAGVYEIAKKSTGKVCWMVHFGYADELFLEIGEKKPYTGWRNGKFVDLLQGEWTLGSVGTDWVLWNDGEVIVNSNKTREELLPSIKKLENHEILDVNISFPSSQLDISFSEGFRLEIVPKPEDDELGMPYWELYTPDDMVLQVGPNLTWSYISSK